MGGKTRTQSKQAVSYNNQNTSSMKAQGWGAPTVEKQLQTVGGMQDYANQRYMQSSGFNPEQQASWEQTMQAVQGWGPGGPGAYAAEQYVQPILEGGYQQYIDPQSMEAQRAYLQNALPGEREEFAADAAKQLGPYRHGGEAAAFGAGWGKLLLDQAARQSQLEGQLGQRVEAAKQLYGQQAPAVASQAAGMMDPTGWGKTAIEMGGMPATYEQQMRANELAQVTPLSQLLQGYSQMAYQFPQETTSKDVGSQYGRGVTTTAEGGMQCCFIMAETSDLTNSVRNIRDELHSSTGWVAQGYRKMANWLVPAMRKMPIVKKIVKLFLTGPIAKFSDTRVVTGTINWALVPICLFWTSTWNLTGRLAYIIGNAYELREYSN